VIELLLKTIAEDDDISPRDLDKRTIELQTRDEDYYGKKYAHLREGSTDDKPAEQVTAQWTNWL
jgi:hypothetical protein